VTNDRDTAVRVRAFAFLREQQQRFGEASIPRPVLERGFDFEGVRVPLIGPQGIFKPAILPELPLTITTAPPVEHRERPYDDGSSTADSSAIAIAVPIRIIATT
jgi:putative restriction endonuclease